MTFSTKQLIKIGHMFIGACKHDTIDLAEKMNCDEADIYNALTAARAAYRKYLQQKLLYRIRDDRRAFREKHRVGA